MQRAFTNVLSVDVEASAKFYETVLGMRRHYNSDWFVIMTHDNIKGLEFGLLKRDHSIVPESIRTSPAGVIATLWSRIAMQFTLWLKAGAAVVEPPMDMPYGQRRMLLLDPDGTVLDISAPIAPLVG